MTTLAETANDKEQLEHWLTCLHEAAHAVIGVKYRIRVEYVEVRQKGTVGLILEENAAGCVLSPTPMWFDSLNPKKSPIPLTRYQKQYIQNRIGMVLAGLVAEFSTDIFKDEYDTLVSDYTEGKQLAKLLTGTEDEQEVIEIINRAFERVSRDFTNPHVSDAVESVRDVLLTEYKMTKRHLRRICRKCGIP